jgi:hypothetical protein
MTVYEWKVEEWVKQCRSPETGTILVSSYLVAIGRCHRTALWHTLGFLVRAAST